MVRAGLELGASELQIQHSNRAATQPPKKRITYLASARISKPVNVGIFYKWILTKLDSLETETHHRVTAAHNQKKIVCLSNGINFRILCFANIIFLTTDWYHCNKIGWGEGVISKETVVLHWLRSEI